MADISSHEDAVQLNFGKVPRKLRDRLTEVQAGCSEDGKTLTLAETLEQLLADRDALTKLFYRPEDTELASMRLAIERHVTGIAEIFTVLTKRFAEHEDNHAQELNRVMHEHTRNIKIAGDNIAALQHALATSEQEQKKLRSELEKEREERESAANRYRGLEQAVEQLAENRKQLREQLAEQERTVNEERSNLRRSHDELHERAFVLEDKLKEAEQRTRTLIAELHGAEVTAAAATARAASLEQQAELNERQRETLEGRLFDAMETIRGMTAAFDKDKEGRRD